MNDTSLKTKFENLGRQIVDEVRSGEMGEGAVGEGAVGDSQSV